MDHLRAVRDMVAHRVLIQLLERHRSRWLRDTAGQRTSLAGIRHLRKLKKIVLVADLDLDLVDELQWALVGRLVLLKKGA